MGDIFRLWMPHAACFMWSPALLWPLALGGSVIAASYFLISHRLLTSLAALSLPAKAKRLALLFAAFIFACGIGHGLDVWVLWSGAYGVQAVWSIVTASISAVTAWKLRPLLSGLSRTPSAKGARAGEFPAEPGAGIGDIDDGPTPPPLGEDGAHGALVSALYGLGFEAQDLFEAAGVAVSVTGPDGFVHYSSPLMVEIFGQSLQADIPIEEWVRRYQPFRPDHTTPIPLSDFPAVLAAQHKRRFAHAQSNLRPDGRWADVYLSASPLIRDGEVLAVVNTAIPLSEAMTTSSHALLRNLERMMAGEA